MTLHEQHSTFLPSRRGILRLVGPLMVAAGLPVNGKAKTPQFSVRSGPTGPHGVRAPLFDVFCILVDLHTGVAREALRLLPPLDRELDWLALANTWHRPYQPSLPRAVIYPSG